MFQEFHIANQVGDEELHGDLEVLHELAVGREIIAGQGACSGIIAQPLAETPRQGVEVDGFGRHARAMLTVMAAAPRAVARMLQAH